MTIFLGTSPELDREKLLNYDLPQPIESYLKPVSGDRTFPKGFGPFQCSICGCRCRTKKAIIKHKTKYHTDKYHCPSCRKDFPQNLWYEFIKHMFEHTLALEQTLLHECINCGYSTDVLSRLDHHRVTHGKFHNNECAHIGNVQLLFTLVVMELNFPYRLSSQIHFPFGVSSSCGAES